MYSNNCQLFIVSFDLTIVSYWPLPALRFSLQSFNKLTYPSVALVVFLAVGDEDVVTIAFNYGGHQRSIYFIIKFKLNLNQSQFSFSLGEVIAG